MSDGDGSRKVRISGLGGFLAISWIGLGTLGIVRGITGYDMGDVVWGIGAFLLAPLTLFLSSSRMPAVVRRTWRYRLALASGGLAMAINLVALVATVRDENPIAWLGIGRMVAPADLVRTPLLYNNAPVHVHGSVVATAHGCALLAGDTGMGSTGKAASPTNIWLAYRSNQCPLTATRPVRVELSGTFHAFRASRGRAAFYAIESPALVGVHATPAAGP